MHLYPYQDMSNYGVYFPTIPSLKFQSPAEESLTNFNTIQTL